MLDRDHYDRARDELAVPDPFATEWETVRTHGLIKPEDVPARPLPAGTPLNASIAQALSGHIPLEPSRPYPPPTGPAGLAGTP